MDDDLTSRISAAYQDFEHVEVMTRDGVRLSAWETGPRDAAGVVIVNPVSVPIVISTRLCRRLAKKYRVTCWEQRGFRSTAEEFYSRPHAYGSFVDDVADIVAARYPDKLAGLVGVCSGAGLAIAAAARGLVRPRSLVLVSPLVRFRDGYVPSLFDSAFVPYMRMISSGNRRLALALMELRAAYSKEPGAAAPAADEQLIEAADTLSLRSLDGLRVYARTIQTFSDQMLDADIKALARKTFVFAATDDRTVSIHSTRRLCRMLPKAHPYEYPTGGHFAVFVRDDLREQISHVIDARQRGAH